jgi:hypothetical protein
MLLFPEQILVAIQWKRFWNSEVELVNPGAARRKSESHSRKPRGGFA